MKVLPDPPLMMITDRRQARLPLADIATAVFDAGIRWFSVREKNLPLAAQLDIVGALKDLAPTDAVVGLHGKEGASAVDALHLPRDGTIGEARQALPKALIGQSCHSETAARAAAESGADYVTLSPIFLSESKPGYGPACGLEALAQTTQRVSCPVIALGGVTVDTIAACRIAGAAGVAVMGEVMRAEDPVNVARDLLENWRRAKDRC